MRRGDIVIVAGGIYASKPRPALIVQDDKFDATDSLTVCPFTSTQVDAPPLRVSVTGTGAAQIAGATTPQRQAPA